MFAPETVEKVLCHLLRFGSSRADAEDLAQEALLIAWRERATFDASRSLDGWLYGIARNVYRNHARRERRNPIDIVDDPDATHASPSLGDVLTLQRALQALPETQQDIVILHELEGHTLKETASLLEIPFDTAKDRLKRARATLETSCGAQLDASVRAEQPATRRVAKAAVASVLAGLLGTIAKEGGAIAAATAAAGTSATGGTASTGTASTGTASTGTAATGTAATGTASTGTASTGTASTGTASTGTASTGTASTGTASTGTASTGTASTGTASTGTVSTGTASTGTASTGTASTGTASTGTAATGAAATSALSKALLVAMLAGGIVVGVIVDRIVRPASATSTIVESRTPLDAAPAGSSDLASDLASDPASAAASDPASAAASATATATDAASDAGTAIDPASATATAAASDAGAATDAGTAIATASDTTAIEAVRTVDPQSAIDADLDSLGAEATLVDRARVAMRTNAPREALRVLAAHERQFPRGQLAEERELLAIEAHVALRETAPARARITRFRAAYPRSAHTSRIDELEKTLVP